MKLSALLVLLACLLVAAEAPKEDVEKEMKLLQGSWRLVKGEKNGVQFTEEMIQNSKLTFKDGIETMEIGGKTLSGPCIIDPTLVTKTMDLHDEAEKRVYLGIYTLDGDRMEMAYCPRKDERPTEFTSKPGTAVSYFLWTRIKE